MFERVGVLDLFEHTLSVEDVQCWKPAPASYQYAATTLDLPLDQMALVAVHPWDVMGAQQAGMVGVWIERRGTPYPDYLPAPDITISDLRQLPNALAK